MTKREKIEARLKENKPVTELFKPDPVFELEMARRIARHSAHDASRTLAEASHFMTTATRPSYTLIISGLMQLRNRLDELSPIAQAYELFVAESDPGGNQ